MLHRSDEERLSAYFDEELSSDECAEVERLLRDNPAARAWLEQVEDLHAELQSLPKIRLEADFAEGVMRRAEREMLLQREASEPQPRISAVRGHDGAATRDRATVPHGLTAVDHGLAAEKGIAAEKRMAEKNGVAAANLAIEPEVGSFSRSADLLSSRAANAPSVIVRPTIAAARRWHAPSWLAAAASLLLFAGVWTLGPSERNWANTASPGKQMARGLPPLHGARDRRSTVVLALPIDETGDKSREKLTEMELDAHGMGQRSSATRGDGIDKAAGSIGQDVSERQATASAGGLARGGGGGGLAKSASLGGAAFGGAPLGDRAASDSKADPATNGAAVSSFSADGQAVSSAPANSAPANSAPANFVPASIVVVDVDGAPAEAFERIEQVLRREPTATDAYRFLNRDNQGRGAKAAERVTLQQATGPKVAGPEEDAKRGTKHQKKDEETRLELGDVSAARVYLVDCAPEELARMLHDVAVLEKTDVAVTRLESSLPLREDESLRPLDRRLRQTTRETTGAVSGKAEFDDRRQLEEPVASDPTAVRDQDGSGKQPGQDLSKKDLPQSKSGSFDSEDRPKNIGQSVPGPAVPGNVARRKALAEDAAKTAPAGAGGGPQPVRAATTVPPPAARGPAFKDVTADSKQGKFKSADQARLREEGREKSGAAPAGLSRIDPSRQARFAMPTEEATKPSDHQFAPTSRPGQPPSPSKPASGKEILRAAEKTPSQTAGRSLDGASSPAVATTSRATIVVLRVNPSSQRAKTHGSP